MDIRTLCEIVIGISIKIHTRVGPGCFEKVYEEILCYELSKLNIKVKRQVVLPIDYETLHIKNAYKLDLLINDMLIVELKSVQPLPPVFFKQIHTQLSLLDLKNGMILNFKVDKMKDGLYRVYNNRGRESLNS